MEFIELDINGKDFIIVNFPKSCEVEQLGGDIIFKEQSKNSFKKLPPYKRGYLKLISKINELDVEKIFDKISPYNFNNTSGKRFIDNFLNSKGLTIDEDLLEIEELKNYKFLDNPYIFRLIENSN